MAWWEVMTFGLFGNNGVKRTLHTDKQLEELLDTAHRDPKTGELPEIIRIKQVESGKVVFEKGHPLDKNN